MKYSYNMKYIHNVNKKNIFIFIIIMIFVIVLFNFFVKKNTFSGFQNYYTTKWSPDLIRRFNLYQMTMNDNVTQFNLDQLQKQASPEEVEEYLKTGYWHWPDDLKKLYVDYVWSNTMIKIDPQYALNYAMTIYNQNAVRELLAWNSKEGQFLLYGVDLGYTKDEMPQIHPSQNKHNTIKCSNSIDNSHMEKTVYNGMNLWNGFMNSTTTIVKPEDIPKEVPGFSFVKGPCNPCSALNFDGDFSCPFRIKVNSPPSSVRSIPPSFKNGDDSISEPWKQLWNL